MRTYSVSSIGRVPKNVSKNSKVFFSQSGKPKFYGVHSWIVEKRIALRIVFFEAAFL